MPLVDGRKQVYTERCLMRDGLGLPRVLGGAICGWLPTHRYGCVQAHETEVEHSTCVRRQVRLRTSR